jgi:biopolymer transport protein ExbB
MIPNDSASARGGFPQGSRGCIRITRSYYVAPNFMKIVASFLAVVLSVASLSAQDPGNSRKNDDSPAKRETVSNPGAPGSPVGKQPRESVISRPVGEDMMAIKSPARRPPGAPDKGLGMDPVKLWNLVESGGWAMIPLGGLSVLTVMLVLVYLVTLRRGAILTARYMNTADVLLKKRDYLGLLAISNRHSEAVARVVQRTLDFVTKNPNASFEVVKEIAQTEGQSQAAALQNRPVYLADIGTLAPMIGLLGTVVGIIHSFGMLGSKEAAQASGSRDMLLASGVSEALVATGTGLVVGIVAMGFYSLFRNRVQSLISDLETASAHVLALVALNYHKKRETSRVPSDDEF